MMLLSVNLHTNKVRAVYNHAEHLDKRKDMMQQWSDYLDKLKTNHQGMKI